MEMGAVLGSHCIPFLIPMFEASTDGRMEDVPREEKVL